MNKEIRNQIFNLPEGGSSGSRWTALKAFFISQSEEYIITEDDKNIVTEPYTE